MADPVVNDATVVQRDTAQTFLVDISIEVYDPDGDDLTLSVEWSHGAAGPWTTPTAQAFDRRHTITTPLTGIPVAPPGTSFNFVWNAFLDLDDDTFDDIHVRLTVVDPGASWGQLVVGPTVIVTKATESVSDVFARARARRAIIDRTPLDFLGNGLVIPFQRGSSDFNNDEGVNLIRSSVRQILGTRAAHGIFVGDLPWRPDFGSKIWILRHRNNDAALESQAFIFAMEAMRWEPRVKVTEVGVIRPKDRPTELHLRVFYRIIDENIRGNRVVLPTLS